MGYTKSFGVLSRNAGQETGSTAFVRCQRSRQRGPEEVSKHKHPPTNQYPICLSVVLRKISIERRKKEREKKLETIKQNRNQIPPPSLVEQQQSIEKSINQHNNFPLFSFLCVASSLRKKPTIQNTKKLKFDLMFS